MPGWDKFVDRSDGPSLRQRVEDILLPDEDTIPQEVQIDMGNDPCCANAKAQWIEGLEQIFGTDTLGDETGILASYEQMDCEEFKEVLLDFAGERPSDLYRRNVTSRKESGLGPNHEHYLAQQVLQTWDECGFQGQDTLEAQDMGFYASAHPMDRAWDIIQKINMDEVPDENKDGDCYMLAGRWVCDNPGYHLAHAEVTGQGPIEGTKYGHAFATYYGDMEGNLHEGEPEMGKHMEWAYDPSADVRMPLALYSYFGRFRPEDIIRYDPETMMQMMAQHSHWGPWDESAQNWLHSDKEDEEDIGKAEPMQVRGLGITPAIARQIAGDMSGRRAVPSPLKWPGGKGRPAYLAPLRDAYQLTGGDRRLVDPFLGGANIPLNLQPKEALLNDYDTDLISAYRAMRDAPGGLQINWGQHTDAEGKVPKSEWMENIRGGLPRGRSTDEYENVWPPREGSLNAMVQAGVQRGQDPEQLMNMIRTWLKMQQGAYQGYTRTNSQGLHNIAQGHTGPYADEWDYSHYQPLMQNWELQDLPIDQFLEQNEFDANRDFMTLDPPYLGEPANYTDRVKGEASFDEFQPLLAQRAGELAEDGMPIVAFNSAAAQDAWGDAGFDTALHSRMDTTAGKGGVRAARPEMVAWANIPDMDVNRWFRQHPQSRWTTEDLFRF